jgi:D-arabinose 5-phosphate isomerase GutQ
VSGVDQAELLAVARSVIEADARAVHATLSALNEGFLEVARLLATMSGKALVTASGTSGNIASRGAHLLSVCGTPAFYLSPAEGLHGGLGALQPDDVVIALSKGGGSEELNEFCRRAKALCRAVIIITGSPKSALASVADYVIAIPLEDAWTSAALWRREARSRPALSSTPFVKRAGSLAVMTGNGSSSPILPAPSDGTRPRASSA